MKTVYLLFILSILYSCKGGEVSVPIASFYDPQPIGVKNISTFPKSIQGDYTDSAKSCIITINDSSIFKTIDYSITGPKDSLDSFFVIKENKLIDTRGDGDTTKIILNGNNITIPIYSTDTMFKLYRNVILKKYKGYYFINEPSDVHSWVVNKVYLSKGILRIGGLYDSTEITKLKTITQTAADTISTPFKLTKKQFKHFIKQGGFEGEQKYYKIKKQ